MDFDFKSYSQERVSFYNELSSVNISDFKKGIPFEINTKYINTLNEKFADFFKRRDTGIRLSAEDGKNYRKDFREISPLCEHIFEYKGSAIYWFKISHITDPVKLNTQLSKKFLSARKKDKKGWWSKINSNINAHTEYLYVGKIEKNLSDRFLQHLGLGHKKTSSIKLLKWFLSFDDVTLTFEYIKIPENYKGHLEDIENVIWRKLNPLIGAEPRIKSISKETK